MEADTLVGGVDVLNCHLGDLKIEFNKDDPADVEKAKQAIQDMMRRGFVLLVEVDGQTKRVKKFDPAINCYIVDQTPAEEPDARKRKRGRPVRADKTRATAIAPRAGG